MTTSYDKRLNMAVELADPNHSNVPYTPSELRDECVADTKKQVKENNDRGMQLREIIGELGWKNAMKKHLKDFQVYICILAKNK